jgi:hypothetical protein
MREKAMDTEHGDSRRGFLRKSAYVVPAVLTLNLALVEARAGSDDEDEDRKTGGSSQVPNIRDQRDVTR